MPNDKTPIDKKRKLRGNQPDQKPQILEDQVLQHHQRYYDDGGDLEIVTSDNVLFKIHSYEMQAVSIVFRDMLQAANNSRITFVDKSIETYKVLEVVLNILMHDGTIASLALWNGLDVIKFAQKYDCTRFINHIKMQLRCNLVVQGDKSRTLRFALALQDYELAAQAIENSKLFSRPKQVGDFDYDELKVRQPVTWNMNPSSLSYWEFQSAPKEAFWAWNRAYHKAIERRLGHPTIQDAQVMSKEFLRLMTLPEMQKVLAKSGGSA